ncbi:hypothetical protein F4W66_15395 [Escherichia coli]|nr:hypothetical protein F4W66_15395 [Escherichia coli]
MREREPAGPSGRPSVNVFCLFQNGVTGRALARDGSDRLRPAVGVRTKNYRAAKLTMKAWKFRRLVG